MKSPLLQALDEAREAALARGFRHTGVYHLLWVIWKKKPDLLRAWLEAYQAPVQIFAKMLETVLRPRRAGGGIARDRREAELLEEVLQLARLLEESTGRPTDIESLGQVFAAMAEDPILSLCRRFEIPCQPPKITST